MHWFADVGEKDEVGKGCSWSQVTSGLGYFDFFLFRLSGESFNKSLSALTFAEDRKSVV